MCVYCSCFSLKYNAWEWSALSVLFSISLLEFPPFAVHEHPTYSRMRCSCTCNLTSMIHNRYMFGYLFWDYLELVRLKIRTKLEKENDLPCSSLPITIAHMCDNRSNETLPFLSGKRLSNLQFDQFFEDCEYSFLILICLVGGQATMATVSWGGISMPVAICACLVEHGWQFKCWQFARKLEMCKILLPFIHTWNWSTN